MGSPGRAGLDSCGYKVYTQGMFTKPLIEATIRYDDGTAVVSFYENLVLRDRWTVHCDEGENPYHGLPRGCYVHETTHLGDGIFRERHFTR